MSGFRTIRITLAILATGLFVQLALPESPTTQTPVRLILQLKPGMEGKISGSSKTKAILSLSGQLRLPSNAILSESGFTQWRRQQIMKRGGDDAKELGTLSTEHRLILELPPGTDPSPLLLRLKQDPRIAIAEQDHVGYGGGLIPSDPNYNQQWHHRILDSSNAWVRTTGSSNVIVAVLDTGIRTNLTEFAGRILPGYDFANNDSDPYDDYGHGTSVSGALAANGSNGILVAGMDWHCKVLPVKVLDSQNSGLYSWWADGIDYAVSNGAKVINLSAGGSVASDSLSQAISNAINHGVIFVTITHNDGTNVVRFPGSLNACITVGSTGSNDVRSTFSNYGSSIDVVAPGELIATVSSNGTLQYWSGTSLAAPLVSGICSLMASVDPTINQTSALALLKAGAKDRAGDAFDTPGFDVYYGYGRVNADYSLWLMQSAFTDVANPTNSSIRLRWSAPSTVSNQAPFGIAYANTTTSVWTRINTPSNVIYTSTTVEWTDTGAQTGSAPGQQRLYRHFIR